MSPIATPQPPDGVTEPPRIPDSLLAEHPTATMAPAPHTAAEVKAIAVLLRVARASTITIGHGRHDASTTTALAIADAWTRDGGVVFDVVNWPASAASWLRPARRLVSGQPDAWVIADTPAGFAQLARRLAAEPDWTPTRTFGSASLDCPQLAQLVGPTVLNGLSGATADGGTWRMIHRLVLQAPPRGDRP